jgi:hypothetical protein
LPKNEQGPFYTLGYQCPPGVWRAEWTACEAPEDEAAELLAPL